MPKKQKRILQIAAVFGLLIIGFSVWANTYHFAESVQK